MQIALLKMPKFCIATSFVTKNIFFGRFTILANLLIPEGPGCLPIRLPTETANRWWCCFGTHYDLMKVPEGPKSWPQQGAARAGPGPGPGSPLLRLWFQVLRPVFGHSSNCNTDIITVWPNCDNVRVTASVVSWGPAAPCWGCDFRSLGLFLVIHQIVTRTLSQFGSGVGLVRILYLEHWGSAS